MSVGAATIRTLLATSGYLAFNKASGMPLQFDERKATQLVAHLLARAGGRLNVLKLMKLAYLADRRALVDAGRPITFDQFVSMPHGPVLSATLNLINEEPDPRSPSYWTSHISERLGHDVTLLKHPGADALSRFETETIDRVYDEFGHMDRFVLRDLTHDLPEYRDPHGSSRPIYIREILGAEGYSEEDARSVEIALEHEAAVAAALGA